MGTDLPPGHVYKFFREVLRSQQRSEHLLGKLEEGQRTLNDNCASMDARLTAHINDEDKAHGRSAREAVWARVMDILKLLAAFGGGAVVAHYVIH